MVVQPDETGVTRILSFRDKIRPKGRLSKSRRDLIILAGVNPPLESEKIPGTESRTIRWIVRGKLDCIVCAGDTNVISI